MEKFYVAKTYDHALLVVTEYGYEKTVNQYTEILGKYSSYHTALKQVRTLCNYFLVEEGGMHFEIVDANEYSEDNILEGFVNLADAVRSKEEMNRWFKERK